MPGRSAPPLPPAPSCSRSSPEKDILKSKMGVTVMLVQKVESVQVKQMELSYGNWVLVLTGSLKLLKFNKRSLNEGTQGPGQRP